MIFEVAEWEKLKETLRLAQNWMLKSCQRLDEICGLLVTVFGLLVSLLTACLFDW